MIQGLVFYFLLGLKGVGGPDLDTIKIELSKLEHLEIHKPEKLDQDISLLKSKISEYEVYHEEIPFQEIQGDFARIEYAFEIFVGIAI